MRVGAPEAPPPRLPPSLAGAASAPGAAGAGASSAGGGSGGAAGGGATAIVFVVPSEAAAWRSYVEKFQGAYCLLQAFLTAPLHVELLRQLCSSVAGLRPPASAGTGSLGEVSGLGAWAGGTTPPAAQLLRQRHVLSALRSLAQVLLCFTDPQLLKVLVSLPADAGGATLPAQPLFHEGYGGGGAPELCHEVSLAICLAWAALLGGAAVPELRPLLQAASQQLQQLQLELPWALPRKPPPLEASELHKAFALEVITEFEDLQRAQLPQLPQLQGQGQDQTWWPISATPSSSAQAELPGMEKLPRLPSSLHDASFVGSEWQRPVREGEVEFLLLFAFWLACVIDWGFGRPPKQTLQGGKVPQTEWPRMLANWKLSASLGASLLLSVLW